MKKLVKRIQNEYATVYVYFECTLIGAIICAVRAVRHKPSPDQDYILILGCGFRKDGTLSPLLRGRVDRAVSFWKEQRENFPQPIIMFSEAVYGQAWPGSRRKESEAGPNGGSGRMLLSANASGCCRTGSRRKRLFWLC